MSKKNELIATGTGAIIGTGAVGTSVIYGGAVVGTSAAGLTSGLAAVGSVVGGGMAAGIGVVCAAPILAAGAGFGLYKLFK